MAGEGTSLLGLPTREAVIRIAGRQLAAAAKGLRRLENPDDARALHAFRVAVRRLRSLLRDYQPWIGRLAGRKVRRALRELMRETNAARDAEIQLGWLAGHTGTLARSERPGCSWLMRRMQKRKRRAYRSAREHLAQDFRDVARRMRRRMQDAAEAEPGAYRDAMAERLAGGAAKLRARTGSIAAADDEKNVHRSRIQVKRLRYLVEPLRKELPEARQLVRELGRLQDLLGELHDLHVLQRALARAIEQAAAERARRLLALAVGDTPDRLAREQRLDERLGLLALAGRARDERDRLFARLQRDWLGRAGTLLKDEVDSLSSVLARAA